MEAVALCMQVMQVTAIVKSHQHENNEKSDSSGTKTNTKLAGKLFRDLAT